MATLTYAHRSILAETLPSYPTDVARRSRYDDDMAAKQSIRRAASQNGQVAASNGWRSHVHTPAEPDPKKRAQAIRRAATRIKTTARIDTITLGRD